jgi:predicted murein hydrolase (TIGR00659 family)
MNGALSQVFESPFFGIALSICCYSIGVWLNRRTKSPLANPLLVAVLLIISILTVLDIPLSSYSQGGVMISMFLGPATAVLALAIYRQRKLLKNHCIAILCGTFAGSAVSLASVWVLAKAFGMDDATIASLLPKSVTTPIAIEISGQLGGQASLTVVAVVITGIFGNIMAPSLIKLMRISDPIAVGVGIGTCSHAVGTSKAIELGEVEGAMSSIALSMSGIITVVLAMVFF